MMCMGGIGHGFSISQSLFCCILQHLVFGGWSIIPLNNPENMFPVMFGRVTPVSNKQVVQQTLLFGPELFLVPRTPSRGGGGGMPPFSKLWVPLSDGTPASGVGVGP